MEGLVANRAFWLAWWGQVDVLVSEPMGTLLVNERMIESFIYARDRHLKPDGKMFPVGVRVCWAGPGAGCFGGHVAGQRVG